MAEILEEKYALFTIFYELHEEEIADQFAVSMAGTLENLVMGAPPTADVFGAVTQWIVDRFKQFLENEEMDETGTPGVPTRAARHGVNHRLKINKGAPRPSFIDTGLMEASFAAWVSQT